ncbi:hypothetical protein [Streptomyces sp. NPDC096132]
MTVTPDWKLGTLSHTTAGDTPPVVSWRCDNTALCDTVTSYRISR